MLMPLFWLNRALGYVAEPLNFPSRFLAITATALAGAGALAAAGRRARWVAPLAVLAVIEVAWGQMVSWPWNRFVPRDASALEAVRDLPDAAVVDLSLLVRSDHENRWNALSTQIAHSRPLNAVPIERIEYFARDGAFFAKALPLFQDLGPLYENHGGALQDDDPKDFYRADLALLQDAGFGYVLVAHRGGSEMLPGDIVRELGRLCGDAVARGPGLGMWALPKVNYSPEELAGWKATHDAAVAELARMTPGMGPPTH